MAAPPAKRDGTLGPAVCTIVAKNYLAYARTLMKSLRLRHPDLALYVLFVDDIAGFVDPSAESFRCLGLADLPLPRPRELCFRYDVMELSTAVKPFLLRQLFARGHGKVLYIDPDIWVFRPLDELFAWLDESDVLLTPHLTGPLGDGHYPDERDILLSGTYNLGFLGIADTEQVDALLRWWSERCEFLCVSDITHGMFVDQRWMDLAPGLVDSVRIVRDPGYNLAYWNLKHRQLSGPPEAPLANGSPVRFYHWSGFDATKPTALSKHQDRFPKIETEPLLTMAREYSAELLSAGHRTSTAWPYSLGSFKDGHPIAKEMRDLFRTHPPGRFPDPFEPAGEDSFVHWAVTPPPAGGPAPLLEKVHASFARIDRSPRWKRTLAGRVLRKVAVKTLVPLREALRRRAPLAPLAGRVLERRADVQQAFARPGGGIDRLEFVRWLSHDGIVHHQLKPAWATAWLAEVEDVGVMRALLDFYDGDAEAQRLFPQAFVEEHDADAFLAWLETHAASRGFPASSLAPVRRLVASRPSERIRAIYASRPDVQGAYPDALASPPASGFVGWLHVSGREEHGLSEDSVLWFERAALQHACRRVDAAWRERAEWRARQPLAQTVFGRAAFLDWLRAEHAELVPAGLERLCAAAGLAPVDELRLFHREDAEAQARGPRAFEDPDDTDALLEVVRGRAAALGLSDAWIEEARRALPPMALREGATVVGYLRTESGMGELSRSTARALKAAGYPIATRDVDDAPQRQFDLSLAHEDRGHPLPYTIVHLNAPEAVRHAPSLAPWLRDRHAIGYWAWELAELPDDWTEAFGLFREVWTCSVHAATAIAKRAPVPVQTIWPALPDQAPSALGREDFGLPADRFTFLFLYDLLSESARKNPLGLLDAFRRAFRADDRVQLVIKTSNGDLRRDDWKRLAAAAEGLPVTLFDRYLSRADVLALVRSCDAYTSLHRAEGFGYTMAEAMALGRPVIATHYSGNADFMTPWNSFPVPYRLVELDETHGRYARGQVWADPDLDAAAELMRSVVRDRERAAAVAERGREDVTRQLSPAACGARIVARLRELSRLSAPNAPAPPAADLAVRGA
ncbi:MAG: glycosyltransferase [Vicinamibacteria bacterium]